VIHSLGQAALPAVDEPLAGVEPDGFEPFDGVEDEPPPVGFDSDFFASGFASPPFTSGFASDFPSVLPSDFPAASAPLRFASLLSVR
jgi:hypothetical protein